MCGPLIMSKKERYLHERSTQTASDPEWCTCVALVEANIALPAMRIGPPRPSLKPEASLTAALP